MKKIISTVLALAMVLSMGVMSFAAAPAAGDFYIIEDGDLVLFGSGDDLTLEPDTTYYIAIGDFANDEAPTKARVEVESYDLATDKKVSVVSSENLSVSKKKLDGTYYYFAALKLKEISANVYKDKDIELKIEDTRTSFKGSSGDENVLDVLNGNKYSIKYPDVYEINDKLSLISLEKETEEYDFEDTDATLEVDSEGIKTDMLISCDTSYDSNFGGKYMNANLEFYYFNGAEARRAMTLTIPKDGFNYVYERTSSGLKDITKTSGKDFVIKTSKLGKYVLSDIALPASGTVTPAVPATPVTPTLPQGPTGGNVPFNPGTGAAI